jgi:hypothetical protein
MEENSYSAIYFMLDKFLNSQSPWLIDVTISAIQNAVVDSKTISEMFNRDSSLIQNIYYLVDKKVIAKSVLENSG